MCAAVPLAVVAAARSPAPAMHPAVPGRVARAPCWLPSRRPPAAAHSRRRRRAAQRFVPTAAADSGDSEVAVFRFTLGNDALDAAVPRIVGVAGAALLVVNHLLGGQDVSETQVRAEVLGAALAAVAVVTPSIEERLKEIQPGRGRQAAAASVAGATSAFALQPGLSEATKQELAWASYALLLNANICGLAVFWEGDAVLARGLVGGLRPPPASGGKPEAGAVLSALGSSLPAPAAGVWQQQAVYCPDRVAIEKAGAGSLPCVPEGAESLLIQPLLPFDGEKSGSGSGGGGSGGFLLLVSERPRALSAKERAWAAAVAAKLHGALASGK